MYAQLGQQPLVRTTATSLEPRRGTLSCLSARPPDLATVTAAQPEVACVRLSIVPFLYSKRTAVTRSLVSLIEKRTFCGHYERTSRGPTLITVVAVTTYRIAKHSWALRGPGEQNWPETKNVTWTCPHGHTRNSLYWKTRTPLKRRLRRDHHATEVRTEERQRAHLRRHGACTRPASLPASPVDLAGSPQACSPARLGLHGKSGSQLDLGLDLGSGERVVERVGDARQDVLGGLGLG